MVVADAMKRAGTTIDSKAICNAIAKTDLKVSTGTIKFNKLGEVMKAVQNQVVRDGNWHRHSIIDDPKLLAPPSQ
jgi:branched-chain amino acid transport system substrate-binding protein